MRPNICHEGRLEASGRKATPRWKGWVSGRVTCGSLIGLQEIPEIAIKILEHRHSAVRLFLGLPYEHDALCFVGLKVLPEVIGEQEQENPTTGLVPNSRRLLNAYGAC